MVKKRVQKISLLESKNLTYLFIFIFVLVLVTLLVLVPAGIRLTGKVVLSTSITKSFQKISDTQGSFTEVLEDTDYFGGAVASIGDLDGNGVRDIVVTAQQDDDGGAQAGAIYVLFMNVDGTVSSSQKISNFAGNLNASETIAGGDYFGVSVTSADINNDSTADLIVGAYGDDDGFSVSGSIHVLFMYQNGSVNTTQKISNATGNLNASQSILAAEMFGMSLASADINNDGIPDLLVGASGEGPGGVETGAVYVLFMYQNGTVNTSQKISNETGNLNASQSLRIGDNFGKSVASIGDLDGDGIIDIVVGAHIDDTGGSNMGAVYVLFMYQNGTVKSSQKIYNGTANFEGTKASDLFGTSVSSGDFNNDGITDIVVGAQGDNGGGSTRGAVYILFMNSTGVVNESQKISDTDGNFAGELDDIDYFGISVASIGDLDGDDVNDMVVGADRDDDGGEDRGAAYVLFLRNDFVNPAVTFSCTSSVVVGGVITCTCTGTDAGSGVDSTTYTVNPSTTAAGTFSTTCTVTDVAGNSDTSTVSYTVTSPTGGGITAGQPTETHSWNEITANEPVTMEITEPGIDLTGITIATTETVTGASLTVTEIDVTPQSDIKISAGGVNYQGFKINTIGLNDTNIANVTIDFKVNKTWLEEENFTSDDVSLYRKPEQANIWDALNTTLTGDDSDYYYFSAVSPGFSLFVVLMDLSICNNNNICEPELGEDEVNCSNDCTEKKGFFETIKTYLWNGIIFVLVVAIVVVILIIRVNRKKQSEEYWKLNKDKK